MRNRIYVKNCTFGALTIEKNYKSRPHRHKTPTLKKKVKVHIFTSPEERLKRRLSSGTNTLLKKKNGAEPNRQHRVVSAAGPAR